MNVYAWKKLILTKAMSGQQSYVSGLSGSSRRSEHQGDFKITYVEVPVAQEVIRTVTKKEVVEVEKRVPKKEYVHTEKVVEVPEIKYVTKEVEVPRIEEVITHVPRREVVDVPREVIKRVPKIETVIVEKIVEVPGEIVEVPKPYNVEHVINVPMYHDKSVPMTVAQTIVPSFIASEGNVKRDTDGPEMPVKMSIVEPTMVGVDVFIPVPVSMPLHPGRTWTDHQIVSNLPTEHYDHLVRTANQHIEREHVAPLMKGDGAVRDFAPFLNLIPPLESEDRIPGMKKHMYELPPVRGVPKPSRAVSGRIVTQSNMGTRPASTASLTARPQLPRSHSNLLQHTARRQVSTPTASVYEIPLKPPAPMPTYASTTKAEANVVRTLPKKLERGVSAQNLLPFFAPPPAVTTRSCSKRSKRLPSSTRSD